ncbi:MAG: hypothetical protein ACOC1P_03630, partial [Minisyncoccales bacterium]
NTKEENIEEEIRKVENKRNDYYDKENKSDSKKEEKNNKKEKTRIERLQDRITSLAIKDKNITKKLDDKVTKYFTSAHRKILNNLEKENFEEEKTKQLYNYLSLKADVDLKEVEPEEEFSACIKEFKKIVLKKQLTKISRKLNKAEREGKEKEVEELSEKFNKLSKKIREKDE